jgi:hypothetical protein
MDRSNLTVLTGTLITRVLFNGRRETGVDPGGALGTGRGSRPMTLLRRSMAGSPRATLDLRAAKALLDELAP